MRQANRRRYHEVEHIIPEPVGRASAGGSRRVRRGGAQPTRNPDRSPRRPPVRRDDHGARGLLRPRLPPGRGRRTAAGGRLQRRRIRGCAQPGQPARRSGRSAGLRRGRPRRPDGVLGRQWRLGHRTCRRRPLLRDGQCRVALFHRPRFPDTFRGPETIVDGLPSDRNHASKSIALHPDGSVFVGIGSPSNACQSIPRTAGLAGKDPCRERETRAGIWRFSTDQVSQTQADGERFAAGVRNAGAIAVHPGSAELYAVIHGRDQLRQLWPAYFSDPRRIRKALRGVRPDPPGSRFRMALLLSRPGQQPESPRARVRRRRSRGGLVRRHGHARDRPARTLGSQRHGVFRGGVLPRALPERRFRRIPRIVEPVALPGRATMSCGFPSRGTLPPATGRSLRMASRVAGSPRPTRRQPADGGGSGAGWVGLRERFVARKDLEDRRGVALGGPDVA